MLIRDVLYLQPRRGGRNAPGVISDRQERPVAGSSKGTKSSEPTKQSTIDTLRLFLLSRYSQPDRLLNLENMAEDPILKEHKLIAPGQPGAPSNMAGAIWKLAKEMFPDVRCGNGRPRSGLQHLLSALDRLSRSPSPTTVLPRPYRFRLTSSRPPSLTSRMSLSPATTSLNSEIWIRSVQMSARNGTTRSRRAGRSCGNWS